MPEQQVLPVEPRAPPDGSNGNPSVQPQAKTEKSAPQNTPSENKPAEPSKNRKAFWIASAIGVVLAIAGIVVWRVFFANPRLPDSLVALSGRIEGDDSAISPRTSGRISEIRFREGDSVKAGEVVALLDDEQVRAREEQAQAAVGQADAHVHSAQQLIGVLEAQLQESHLQTTQAGTDAQGRVKQAEAEL